MKTATVEARMDKRQTCSMVGCLSWLRPGRRMKNRVHKNRAHKGGAKQPESNELAGPNIVESQGAQLQPAEATVVASDEGRKLGETAKPPERPAVVSNAQTLEQRQLQKYGANDAQELTRMLVLIRLWKVRDVPGTEEELQRIKATLSPDQVSFVLNKFCKT